MDDPLLHFSRDPFVLDLTRPYDVDEFEWRGKPHGLWFSVGDAWKEWCLGEDFAVDCLAHCTEIRLQPTARILRIANPEALVAFSRWYGRPGKNLPIQTIDWARVAGDYQGIVIAPYFWQFRLDFAHHWYYSWDCASGCVWDLAAVASVQNYVQAGK